jgi:uncharacterized protein YxjI
MVVAPPALDPGPRGAGRTTARRYRLRQRMVAIGDDFFIQDDQGARVFTVDGQALRARDTLIFRDMAGAALCQIRQRVLRVRDTMEVEGANGETVVQVRKAMLSPLRDRYVVTIGTGPELAVQGNILDHEFHISDGRTTVADISKQWFRVRDSYGVAIGPGQPAILILAAVVCIDQMANPVK